VPPVSKPPWDPLFYERSPLFTPVRAIALRLSQTAWPVREELTRLAHTCHRPIANCAGQAIEFMQPRTRERSAACYEQRIADSGVVEHRDASWHDLLNALVWMTFPRAKAALNQRHVMELEREMRGRRSAARDALTQFDEDGILVVSEQADLLELLRAFQWRELFWHRRSDILSSMRWFVFGHGQYEKALQPFIGLTAKALTLSVEPGFCALPYAAQLENVDRLTAQLIAQPRVLCSPRALAPVPVLGIPGWSAQSEHESFYEDRGYFRSGRRCRTA
jgi:hypothetical protein